MLTDLLLSALWSHQLPWLEIEFYIFFHGKKILLTRFFYLTRGLVNNINISNMAGIILLQTKQWRWGRLSQISRGKFSQVVRVCVCGCAHTRVCYNTIVVYAIHHWKLCTLEPLYKRPPYSGSVDGVLGCGAWGERGRRCSRVRKSGSSVTTERAVSPVSCSGPRWWLCEL